MNVFTGRDFTIYSGLQGDVIVRPDGIWVEAHDKDTEQWHFPLEQAFSYVKFRL